jgi:virginiamycin B lyase
MISKDRIQEGICVHSPNFSIRLSPILSAGKRISILALVFSLPGMLLAQRWDKTAVFPIPASNFAETPNSVTTGPDGALWYTDLERSVVGRMTTTGAVTEYYVYSQPEGITSGPDGALWFGLSGSIGRITTSGSVTSYPLPGGCCTNVQGITPGPDGALWFTEGGYCCDNNVGNRIGRITTTGVITEFDSIPNSNPTGIVAGSDGALWFTEETGNNVGRITTSGFIVEFPVTGCCTLQSITAGQDGDLWFTEPGANRIGRITTRGVVTEYTLPSAASYPSGITGGPDGGIWFTEEQAGRVGRITPTTHLPVSAGDIIIEYALPSGSEPGAITAGPDGNLWYAQLAPSSSVEVGGALGQAAACGLGLSLSYENNDLDLSFALGTSQASTFGAYLIDGTGLKKLWSKSIPSYDPPRLFTETITGFPAVGSVSVFSTIGTPSAGLLCYDLELVNTGTSAGTAVELDQARRAVIENGIVNSLPQP